MKIELDVEGTRRLNKAFEAAKQRDGAIRDQALLDLEEPDERLRRLVQARGQLAQARLCYWGLSSQAVIWGYQGIDNAMHAALLAEDKSPSRNHQKKVEEFKHAFPECAESGVANKLTEACELWNAVRYERTAVSRETGQGLVDLAHAVFDLCVDLVAARMGKGPSELEDRLASIADRVRSLVVVRSDTAIESIELHNMSEEHRLQSMGLSGMASQVAHGGRDIWIEIAADQAWARDFIEGDEKIGEEVATLYESFHEIVTALFAKRMSEKFESDPNTFDKPEETISATDFNLTCVISYAGLSTLDTMRRMVSASHSAGSDPPD